MKRILYENKDIRLDTLRKVFGIDKYKRIRENIQGYVRELKTKKREFEASISDLEGKNQQKKGREHELNNVVNEIKDLQPDTNNIKESLEKQRKVIKEYERDTQDLNKLNNSLEVCDNNILNISEQSKILGNEIEEAEKNIENIKKEVDEKSILNFEKIVKETKEKEKESREKEARLDEIKSKLGELLVLKKKSEGLKEKISKLDICPLCKQKVTKEHIEKIQQEEKEKLKNIDEKIIIYKKQEVAGSDTIKNVKKGIDELKQQERKIEINKVKISNLKEKIERIVRLKKKKEELKNRVAEFNAKRIEIKTRIEKFRNIEEKYNREKEVLEKILEEQREFEIKLSELKKEKEMLEKQLLELQEEINKKLEIKKQINKVSQLQQWLDEYFINLMQAMEKQIMSKVYNEFNDLVREWFNMLIEDEVLNVRLDEEFTPMMEQNGYETSIDNLSGGEKTSVALAYRLALNKVINDLISGIKTKNLIILDEPTDGFSSDQLDRVKEVIDSLDMQQIIIVSHEPKIETFVDDIIRVNKAEHTSHLV